MNRFIIDLHALHHNLQSIDAWMEKHEAKWTVVTKVLCGHPEVLRALQLMGVRSMGDSRLMNLEAVAEHAPGTEAWYLRPPHMSIVPDIVRLSGVSLNSEMEIIQAINDEAKKQGKRHRIIIMIEMGDLREGILPGGLTHFYKEVFDMSHVDVLGIGANVGCLAGAIPNVDQLMQLVLYRELLELKFNHSLPLISAGSSAVLPLVLSGSVPKAVNHFRIGESIFLGNDLIKGTPLDGLRTDAVLLEGEIVEVKEKSMVPLCETSSSIMSFEAPTPKEDYSPGQRGYRALVALGQLDTDISGIRPVDERYRIVGASSDITVVNLGRNPKNLKVGDSIQFRPSYSALLRMMSSKYIAKEIHPSLAEFEENVRTTEDVKVVPVLEP